MQITSSQREVRVREGSSYRVIGHQLQHGLIGLHEDNVAKIRNAPRPTIKKQVRSFLGLAGYYRDFIPNFAAVAVPLSDLTRKGQPSKVEWDHAQEKAYQAIKITKFDGYWFKVHMT